MSSPEEKKQEDVLPKEEVPKKDENNEKKTEEDPLASEEFEIKVIGEIDLAFDKDILKPLKSETTWDQLGMTPNIIKGLEYSGFDYPSQIQAQFLTIIMKTKDKPMTLVAQAKNGSGKTLCYALAGVLTVDPSISFKKDGILTPQVIILEPNLELVNQTFKIIKEKLLKFAPEIIIENIVYLGEGEVKEKTIFSGGHILIGTPNAIEKIRKAKSYNQTSLEKLKMIAVDEADFIIADETESASFSKLVKSLNNVNAKLLMLSATFDEKNLESLKLKSRPNFFRISVGKPEELTLKTVHQFFYKTSSYGDKFSCIEEIFRRKMMCQCIIFVNSKKYAEELMNFLLEKKHSVGVLFGSPMTKEERMETMKLFIAKKFEVLVTTNLISRGIDIRTINFVINADLPVVFNQDRSKEQEPDYAIYLHRNGRTGRFGDCGLVLNIIDGPRSENLQRKIKDYYKCEIQELNDLKLLPNLIQKAINITEEARKEVGGEKQ